MSAPAGAGKTTLVEQWARSDDRPYHRLRLAKHHDDPAALAATAVAAFDAIGPREPTVVLMHGVPFSIFLYGKVIAELADRGFDALCFDQPGLGLADRSRGLDYSIAGLGRFSAAAVDTLGLGAFHLVVHDAGGPIGFELCRLLPGRIRSLTILNTAQGLSSIPYPGELFARFVGRMPAPMHRPDVWRLMMRRVGVADDAALSDAELDAWRVLALGSDAGAGDLHIMRNLRSSHRPQGYTGVLDSRSTPYPVSALPRQRLRQVRRGAVRRAEP